MEVEYRKRKNLMLRDIDRTYNFKVSCGMSETLLMVHDGQTVKCRSLYKIKDVVTKKRYIIYTDYNESDDGEMVVFAGLYFPLSPIRRIRPIEDEADWVALDSFINHLNEEGL